MINGWQSRKLIMREKMKKKNELISRKLKLIKNRMSIKECNKGLDFTNNGDNS